MLLGIDNFIYTPFDLLFYNIKKVLYFIIKPQNLKLGVIGLEPMHVAIKKQCLANLAILQ